MRRLRYQHALLALALSACGEPAATGTITEARGEVSLNGESVVVGELITLKGELVTGQGRAVVSLPGAGSVRVFPNSRLRFEAPSTGHRVRLAVGKVWAQVTELTGGQQFDITTHNAVAGVRGTEYMVEEKDDQTDVQVVSGEVEVKGRSGEPRRVRGRQQVRVADGESPSEPRAYDPEPDQGRWRRLEHALRDLRRGVKDVASEVKEGAKEVGKGVKGVGKEIKEGAKDVGRTLKDAFK